MKWPGGKQWLCAKFPYLFPENYGTYYEPFLGGGAVFFFLQHKKAVLTDLNQELITLYSVMKEQPSDLSRRLKEHEENHCKDYYYQVRKQTVTDRVDIAARMLYLNRSCFNGLYRVNHLGQFNVPIGSREVFTNDIDSFEEYSHQLEHAELKACDFAETIQRAGKNDFIFADPPYIAQKQENFIKYNNRLFRWEDQIRLRNELEAAKQRGAIILCTNVDSEQIAELYKESGFSVIKLERNSLIAADKNKRAKIKEMVISSKPVTIGQSLEDTHADCSTQ